jgi:Fe-S-cluster containining protein
METSDSIIDDKSPCQACGACCSYSQNWPRFTTEDDAALDLIPARFVNERLSGMRCEGDRCSALSGKAGRCRMPDGAATARAAGAHLIAATVITP